MANIAHTPVLLNEVVQALQIAPTGTYLDATYGRGGHSDAILQKLKASGRLMVFDRDKTAISDAHDKYDNDQRVSIFHAPFSQMSEILKSQELNGRVDGVLCDLGVSSPQLDNADRGFSFMADGPLDMRMDVTSGITAADWLEQVDEKEMIRVFRQYGEERFAKRIAHAIQSYQMNEKIIRTKQLADIVSQAVPRKEPGKHPATRVFQAIRIAVNKELAEVESVLPQILEALKSGGRAAMISFHSLEDRLVKQFFKTSSKGDPYPPDLPVPASMLSPEAILVGKQVRASAEEVKANPRSRSAVLRVIEKV